MYRLAKYVPNRDGLVSGTANDVDVEEYIYLSVVSPTGKPSELRAHAKRLGLTPVGRARRVKSISQWREAQAVAVLDLAEEGKRYGELKKLVLGWVKIPDVEYWTGKGKGAVPVRAEIGPMSEEDFQAYINDGGGVDQWGIADFGETVDGESAVIISGWHFYSVGPLLGYTWQSILENYGASEPFGFEDDSDSCGECGLIDTRDNGYTYNFRWLESHGAYYGVRCGCYLEAVKGALEDFVNKPEEAMPRESVEELVDEGKLEFVRRYIGGLTDPGRGGYYDGERVENGDPTEIMAAALKADPDGEYLFSHDESGQFQTYFSLYRVINEDE